LARKKKELPLIEGVEIKGVAAEGKAVARVNDLVVFVPYAAPGDVVDIQLTRKKNSYAEGKIAAVKEYSPFRVEPKCRHFGVCGGCKWQHLDYSKQIEYKQQQVIDNLTRIGKVQLPEISQILGSEKQYYYRNKLEYTFSNRSWLTKEELDSKQEFASRDALGFHIPGMFDKVLDIKECYLQDDISNKIRLSIREYALENGYSFFDLRAQVGDMRGMIVRTASTGEIMLIVIFSTDDKEKISNMMQHISSHFPQITSLMYVVNQKCNDIISDLPIITWSWKDHIIEQMEDLKFKVGPKSFYQTNSEQAYRLYSVVRDFAALT
jgi:23S rRNA (uracil1939-C5)-methyltransferase